MFNRLKIILAFIVLTCPAASAGHYQIYGRVSPYIDTTNGNTRYWSAVLKIRNLTTGSILTCFPADKSTWSQIWAGNYSLIDLSRTDGQDDCYIDYPLDDAGYKSALLQMLNHTHKIGRYFQDQGHQIQIQFYQFSPIDYFQRANDVPIGVRITTPSFTTARQNKLNENLDILDCTITQQTNQIPSVPTLISPTNGETLIKNDHNFDTTISWNSIGASKYLVQVSKSSTFNLSDIFIMQELTSTELNCTGLTIGQNYYWRVSAINENGMSKWSDTSNFKIITQTYRYVRIRSTDDSWARQVYTSYTYYTSVYEIQIFDQPNKTGNVISNGILPTTVCGTGTGGGYQQYLTDNYFTYGQWTCTTNVQQTPVIIAFDFGTNKYVKSIAIYPYSTSARGIHFPKAFTVEGSLTPDFSIPVTLGTFSVENSTITEIPATRTFNVSYP